MNCIEETYRVIVSSNWLIYLEVPICPEISNLQIFWKYQYKIEKKKNTNCKINTVTQQEVKLLISHYKSFYPEISVQNIIS